MNSIFRLCLVCLIFWISSCNDYLDVNKNMDNPDRVTPVLRLGPVLASFEGIANDMRAVAPLCGYFSGNSSFMSYFGMHTYWPASDNGGETWRMVYILQGMNLEDIINGSRELGQTTLTGIGLAIKAYSWHLLSSLHGDVPVKQAFVPGQFLYSYDNQEYTFKMVRSWARQAITELEKTDSNVYPTLGTADLVYGGDVVKWKKFAYAVLARNYLAISMKNTAWLDSVVDCANKSFTGFNDDASLKFQATGVAATSGFFGILRANLSNGLTQSDYMVQIMTGTIPNYNVSGVQSGLSAYQMVTDTATFDPRSILFFGTTDTLPSNQNDIKKGTYKFSGTRLTNPAAVSLYGTTSAPTAATSGTGRWLFRDDAPYPLTTFSEIQFIKAEALYRQGKKAEAFDAFKNGVSGHFDFVKRLIVTGTPVKNTANRQTSVIGDKISASRFSVLATIYLNSRFVNNLPPANFTLSHIMMQKYVALYPWSPETWNDLRRYHYDLVQGPNGVPVAQTSWTNDLVFHKPDSDPARLYKGFYLPPSDNVSRRMKFNSANLGSPCYRLRPRYNSEYLWNLSSLKQLQPIAGDAENYGTSMVWFCQPK